MLPLVLKRQANVIMICGAEAEQAEAVIGTCGGAIVVVATEIIRHFVGLLAIIGQVEIAAVLVEPVQAIRKSGLDKARMALVGIVGWRIKEVSSALG